MATKGKGLKVLKAEEVTSNLQPAIATTPMGLLSMAVNQNLDIEKLERLMAMQEKYLAQRAKEEFFESLSNFQADCPEIKKIRKVSYTSERTQKNTNYTFAALGDVERQIKPFMQRHGLSKRWEIADGLDENKKPVIIVTCLVTHKSGHTEKTTLRAAADDSGGKNTIQQSGSTVSYLERYSLLAALGISTADMDNDGRSAATATHPEGSDIPYIKPEEFKNAMSNVIAGKLTVEEVLKNRSLKPEEKTALEAAEKSAKSKKPAA